MKKSIILFIIYGLVAVSSIVLICLDKPFDFVAAMTFILIVQRIRIIRALNPSGFIHGDGLKYFYEKRGMLEDFKRRCEKVEKVLLIIYAVGIVACTIASFNTVR